MAGKVGDITENSFEASVVKAQGLVMVDFWAPWCGPCKSIAPILEEIATEFDTKITIFKVNVDDNPRVASQYGVRGIPNLVLFKDGSVIDQVVGAVPKEQLVSVINKYI